MRWIEGLMNELKFGFKKSMSSTLLIAVIMATSALVILSVVLKGLLWLVLNAL